MASSDSFVIYLRSSIGLNFTVLASSDDDIASLKKKAEAQHLALFPHNGRIVAQGIKIIHEGIVYYHPDNIPVCSLFDGANKGIRLLYMDAVTVPLESAETRTHVLNLCQNGDPYRGRDRSLNQWGNSSCTSESLKRKSPGGNTKKDPVVKEVTPGIGVLGEFVEGNTKKQKSKDPSSDEVVPPSSEMDLPKTRDRMQEMSASPENVTAGAHLMSGSLGTWNQDAASADMIVLDAAHEGNDSCNEKENNIALEKQARKEVRYTRSTENADVSGETSSLAPSGINLEDGFTEKFKFIKYTELSDSLKKLEEGDISYFGCRRTPQFKNPLSESQTFLSKDELREAVSEFHILNKFEFKWTHSDRKRMRAKCKNITCDWSLSAKAVESEWVITKLPTIHGCRYYR